jgi:hypothetical protein
VVGATTTTGAGVATVALLLPPQADITQLALAMASHASGLARRENIGGTVKLIRNLLVDYF